MRKIDYSKIKWCAATNWEFCGSKENLNEVWKRASGHSGVRLSIEEFGYNKPTPGYAYEKGDIVVYTGDVHPMLAVVDVPVSSNGYFYVRLPDGHQLQVHPRDLAGQVSIADIPDELIALARAEAGRPIDFSKCPLKDPGACMKGGGVAMRFSDLTKDQGTEAKQRLFCERIQTNENRTPSYEELASVDEAISDKEAEEAYAGTDFVPDDFSCGVAADRDGVLDELKEWAKRELLLAKYAKPGTGRCPTLEAKLGIDWARTALLEHIEAVRP